MFGVNPWMIVGAVLLIAAAGWKGYDVGYDVADAKWLAANAEADKKAAEVLAAAVAAKAAKEAELSAIKDQVDKTHAEQIARINGLRIANGRLVAAAGGLYDRNGRPSGGNAVCGNSTASPEPDANPTGCKFSTEATEFLLDLAYDADLAAAYANSCRAWILSVTPK